MNFPIFQIDAFTSRRFRGNPAAVVVLDQWLPDEVLAAVAAENNLAETAFVILESELVPLRWFTPTIEVDLCGHATLAAAHVILNSYRPGQESVHFSTRSGELTVVRENQLLCMDFPARPAKSIEISEDLVAALGVRPRAALRARDILTVFDSEDEVKALRPDMRRIAALDAFAVIASARGKEVDFVSRFFAPGAGVPEDPVTGSAHCTLIPYWSAELGKQVMQARQLSARGGEIRCEMAGDRVKIAGMTKDYLRGEITV
ncbi:MAG TPA: PhzF family phenazine biosynthesis protein, partial [Candidatus Binataceae bacterium]|jgi:PhzF family phenazine biosynthesis protein|nr:PhzF family phenazine biosynthesis protein [Candidatus Binataceae bacterium]